MAASTETALKAVSPIQLTQNSLQDDPKQVKLSQVLENSLYLEL